MTVIIVQFLLEAVDRTSLTDECREASSGQVLLAALCCGQASVIPKGGSSCFPILFVLLLGDQPAAIFSPIPCQPHQPTPMFYPEFYISQHSSY